MSIHKDDSHVNAAKQRTERKLEAKDIWTPCKHYSQCIGYCPFCIAEKLGQQHEVSQAVDLAEQAKEDAEDEAREDK